MLCPVVHYSSGAGIPGFVLLQISWSTRIELLQYWCVPRIKAAYHYLSGMR